MQEKLAILLALIAGFIDAAGFIKWKTYVSFMSGNTTQLGAALFAGKPGIIITSITVIGCFFLGIYTGTCLSLWKKMRLKTFPFIIVAAILVLYTLATCYFNLSAIPSIAIIGFATGIMNTIVTAVGSQKVNTDFVTGTLNSLARNTAMMHMTEDVTAREQYKASALHLLLVWLGFLSGAGAVPFTLPFLGVWIMAVPILLLLTCFIIDLNLNFNP